MNKRNGDVPRGNIKVIPLDSICGREVIGTCESRAICGNTINGDSSAAASGAKQCQSDGTRALVSGISGCGEIDKTRRIIIINNAERRVGQPKQGTATGRGQAQQNGPIDRLYLAIVPDANGEAL